MTVDELLEQPYCGSDFDSVEGLGAWHDPARSKLQVAGAFVFRNDGDCRILLQGSLCDDVNAVWRHPFPAMCGEVDAGCFVTAFDCSLLSCKITGGREHSARMVYVYGDAWFGRTPFRNKESVCFKEVTFGVNNLQLWLGDQVYQQHYADIHRVRIEMDATHVLQLIDDDYVEIVIRHEPVVHSANPGRSAPGVEDNVRVCVRAKNSLLPFYGIGVSFEHYVYKIYQFLSIFIGINPYIYDVRGYLDDERMGGYCLRVKRDVLPDKKKNLNHLAVLLPRGILEHVDYVAIARKYLRLCDVIPNGMAYMATFATRAAAYSQITLPEAIYNFEGMEDALFADVNRNLNQPALSAEGQKLLDSILQKCTQEEVNFLNSRFRRKNVTLRQKILAMFGRYRSVFPYLTGREDAVAKALVDARNGFSHRGDGSFDDRYLYVAFVELVYLLMVTMVLAECGVPIETISRCFNRDGGDGTGPRINIERCFPLANKFQH